MKPALSLQRQEFIRHLFSPSVLFNASEAYRRAYPKCKAGHNKLATRLMANDVIKREVAKRRAGLEKKTDVSVDELVSKLRKLAGIDPKAEGDGIKPLNNADIKGAVELLGKYKGMFKEVNVNLNADIPTDPVEYKLWLQKELDRLNNSENVIESYAKSKPAIAERY